MQENFIVLLYQGDWRTRYTTAQSTSVAHAENFRGGKFRHNHVMSQINFRGSAKGTTIRILGGPGYAPRKCLQNYTLEVLRPVAQLYGQVRTDWNQCFVIDCSLSHPAGQKPFTCSHSVLRKTWLNIHAIHWMRFSAHLSVHVFTISRNLTWALFRQWCREWVVVCLIH